MHSSNRNLRHTLSILPYAAQPDSARSDQTVMGTKVALHLSAGRLPGIERGVHPDLLPAGHQRMDFDGQRPVLLDSLLFR